MIDSNYLDLSVRAQCDLLDLNRSTIYYQPHRDQSENIFLMNKIDQIYTARPFLGYRKIHQKLLQEGCNVGDKRVLRLMQKMGIQATVPGPHTSKPHPKHPVYPYLLRGLRIEQPNYVWATDITYIRLLNGFCYLVAFMDWFSRFVLSWRLSKSLESNFCVLALEDALLNATPDIVNSDQGSQYTSDEYISTLIDAGIQISMDGRGSYMDNIFTERLWRSVKYEEVYLKEYQTFDEAEFGISEYLTDYNCDRPHQALGYKTPFEIHYGI